MKTVTFALFTSLIWCSSITVVNAAPVSGQGTWEITLQGRDLDGNLTTAEAYYDIVLGITWMVDANYVGILLGWDDANAWVNGLDINGYSDWRLPKVRPVDGATSDDSNFSNIGTEDLGYNISAPGTQYADSTASEMAHLYYNTLGNLGFSDVTGAYPQSGWGLVNTGPFINIQHGDGYGYWSDTEYTPTGGDHSFGFEYDVGLQYYTGNSSISRSWAVHDGDIGTPLLSEVPAPAAAWLFGSGLLGLVGVASKRRRG